MKTVWVDLLCWSSVAKLMNLLRKFSIKNIYYINISIFFIPFVFIFQKVTRKQFIKIDWIVESEEKINNVSLYECIQLRITDVLDKWVNAAHIMKCNKLFCTKYTFNIDKYKAHLKEAAYAYLFRPVEITVLDEKVTGKVDSLYLLRRTPFCNVLREACGKERTFFYSTIIPHRLTVESRSDYFYDNFIKKKYYANRIHSILRIFISWFLDSLNGIFFAFVKILLLRKYFMKQSNIGIELIQSRVRLDEVGDLYWLEDSGIQPETVYVMESENYDTESIETLESMGINRFRYHKNSMKMIFHRMTNCATFTDGMYFFKTLPSIMRLWLPLILWNETGWLRLQEVFYSCRTMFWLSIYRHLGIKILWTMYDMDKDKLTKAQAMEKVNGLYVGGHWSNYRMYNTSEQKCLDVLFTWGKHFTSNNFNRYPYMKIFQTGYPLDHYFEKRKSKAVRLRNRSAGKFILSYHDNIMANDLPYSKNMQIQIHKMLLSILKKHDDLIVFLKPKKKFVLDKLLKELPALKQYIAVNRIKVFLGDTHRTKAVPAEIGMASDLVVGLGISTAAAECQFAGTLSFHADLTGFTNNEFGNSGLGQVVFRDIPSLHKAILEQIHNNSARKCSDYKAFYETLDPFQDGQAYRRTGFVLKNLQELLGQGLSREEAVKEVGKRYEKLVLLKYKQIDIE